MHLPKAFEYRTTQTTRAPESDYGLEPTQPFPLDVIRTMVVLHRFILFQVINLVLFMHRCPLHPLTGRQFNRPPRGGRTGIPVLASFLNRKS